jgi:predicted dehydrogenase
MSGKRFNVAVIGAGIAKRHLEAFTRLHNLFDVVALCSLDTARGRDLCKQFGIAQFTSEFAPLLARKDIDVIDICTPPSLHFEMSNQALARGFHVICEKPLVGSLAEIDAMTEMLEKTNRRLMPIFQYRYGKGVQKLKHLIGVGLTGRPILTTIETHWWRGSDYYAVPWRGKWKTELGGGLLNHAIHAHDILTYLLGDIVQVYAATSTLVNPVDTEDTAALTVHMANGSLAALSMTLGSRKQISRLRFCFKNVVVEGTLEPCTITRDPWTFVAGDPYHQRRIDEALAEAPDCDEGYARQFELFHEALVTESEMPVTLTDARRSLELATAAYHSSRSKISVGLPIGSDHPLYRGWFPPDTRAARSVERRARLSAAGP